jgi:glycerophosphoryl diester phosphodiesterase
MSGEPLLASYVCSMRRSLKARGALVALVAASACVTADPARPPVTSPSDARPIVIAHRGASGYRPEHTLAAYSLAIDMGADFIEPDLVSTKDSVLVARHEIEIGGTTDVATKFPDRRTTRTIDGNRVTGWFTEDFTLAELKTLRANERLPFRSHAYDGLEPIPTLEEILGLVERRTRETGRRIGVYPETKHSSYFRSIGRPLEEPLLAALARRGWTTPAAPVFIQSFEVENLRALRARTGVRLVQLIDNHSGPADASTAPDVPATYATMVTPAELARIALYANAIGVEKSLVQPIDSLGMRGTPTPLVADAHRAGLAVHVWTMRSDASILPKAYAGDAAAEWRTFASLGVDGIFGDFPDVGVAALAR